MSEAKQAVEPDVNSAAQAPGGKLYAVSDLHVAYEQNRQIVKDLYPDDPNDWLIVAGDVAELATDVEWTLGLLRDRFAKVIWVPGNHELWTHPRDPLALRGVERYDFLVNLCRSMGVLTPEDPYPVWNGPGGPAIVAPLFVLYDYSFLPAGTHTSEEGLAKAHEAGVVCADEFMLHPDPHPSREAWCRSRLEYTRNRLDACDPELPTVLVNHFPLIREPTAVLHYPEFALWCGTEATADWPVRYRAAAVIYGHLHIPRVIWHDGVPHREVSLGYPREWGRRGKPASLLREVLPEARVPAT